MINNKIFYTDPYQVRFNTELIQQSHDDNGPFAVLKQTSFYPTGGGQPCDLGSLNGIDVTQVEEIDGEIRHYLEKALPETTSSIEGFIDWERRFDHMQQHTGQHILTAAFDELFDIKTIAFHLGKEVVTIDLAIEELTKATAKQAENLANTIVFENRPITTKWIREDELDQYTLRKPPIVFENRPITTKWIREDELDQYTLRKPPAVSENIRLVIIDNFDYNACGGTHPFGTSEAGPIKIIGWERHRQNIRLQFICGKRIIRFFENKQAIVNETRHLLNCGETELPDRVEALISSQKTMEEQLHQASNELMIYEAKVYLQESPFIAKTFKDRSIKECQELARYIINNNDHAVVLFTNIIDEKLQMICARGDKPDINMNDVVKKALPLINGKGGGKPAFAQGGGEALLSGKELLDHLEKLIRE
ncbi:alanyl-tRNA synthetase [Scopulibacillus darangshiensis]|uniref:Alanine--tRNA ligase n=1 Tax=Scopulibacillus darangshiensis TaxID=442528 RepID=A0A4R2PAV4_9BACL|nr:DHHA1 domain-containing protein [Scopulibacillus darangshiensis]TCP31518.1 alanyl-tRNA synthetase [Scopulibacillus darangshiensis]